MEQIYPLLIVLLAGLALAGMGLITHFLIPKIIQYAVKHRLLDEPDERKKHATPKPALGGVAVMIGLTPMLFSFIFLHDPVTWFAVGLGIIALFFTGLRDDLKEMRATLKLFIQFAAASLVFAAGIRIESLFGIGFDGELPFMVQYLLTVLVITGITNAINLMDGIDGLAGGIGVILSLLFASVFWVQGQVEFMLLSSGMVVCLLAFLKHNFHPSKIFLGDNGSLVVGFILAVFGVVSTQNLESGFSMTLLLGHSCYPYTIHFASFPCAYSWVSRLFTLTEVTCTIACFDIA
ncbi:undecaprenyl/decaprenyl-phosphate alpha-N-acetylglucosaminyl 1-phosphate transferase [bacterium SCSIO 12741]|nr:undecaprenyl/decaprenyl-phosphate alpha-N-acetylglucosaminyl 1-phosphate transferase [bacterium SCSIO 12741]